LRIYELCLILHNDTDEEKQDQILKAITDIVARNSGSVLKSDKWGKKNFKYAIRKQSKGHYCFITFESDASALKEIERSIMYNESILRYNFIRLEKFVETPADSAGAAPAEESGDASDAGPEQTGSNDDAADEAAAESAAGEQAADTQE
jgi:small subunit ribosomal protein S6